MNSAKDNQQNNVYQILPERILQESEVRPGHSSQIINDLLRSTVPDKELKAALNEKKHLYMNIKKCYIPTKKNKIKARKNFISRKEKKKLGLLKCPSKGWSYNDLEPLRLMWKEHMQEVLNITSYHKQSNTELFNFNRLMSKADLHGSEMEIIKSRNPNLVGIKGTCVLDARDTFGIVCVNNRYKIIPKEHSVFKIILHNLQITVYGKYLLNRTAERSVKKIKSFIIPVL